MDFKRLRITGFKSFADPVELLIESGLTGIVGPNGCGKSNLVEAMRWVMGETSSRSLRAGEMDDVIFIGTSRKAARSFAEVIIEVDNSRRDAPLAYNNDDTIEIMRRIDRGQGSTYRINGRVVRAADVQLMFADASSGARSPSLVAQGQIGELIAARPTDRRRIIEDAAGISGLYSRRQDAEKRLRRTEENLDQAETLLGELKRDIQALTRQAEQAATFRKLSDSIRITESRLALYRWRLTGTELHHLEDRLKTCRQTWIDLGLAQTEAARRQALANQDLPTLRKEESELSAKIQRLIHERDKIEEEKRTLARQLHDLERTARDAESDQAREKISINDAEELLARLDEDIALLEVARVNHDDDRVDEEALTHLIAREKEVRQNLTEKRARLAAFVATSQQSEKDCERLNTERSRLLGRLADNETRAKAAQVSQNFKESLERIANNLIAKTSQFQDAQALTDARKANLKRARDSLERAREHRQSSQTLVERLGAEIKVLQGLLADSFMSGASVAESLKVAEGFESALGAALGEDLVVSMETGSDPIWQMSALEAPFPTLPEGARPLSEYVTGLSCLAPRLSQIGVVTTEDGIRLQRALTYGQRLVSVEGDLWRWDGLVRSRAALSPLARLLQERNKLDALTRELAEEQEVDKDHRRRLEDQKQALTQAETALDEAERSEKEAARAQESARNDQAKALREGEEKERHRAAIQQERSLLNERLMALDLDLKRAQQAHEAPEDLPREADIAQIEEDLGAIQSELVSLKSRMESRKRERQSEADRLIKSRQDRQRWQDRLTQAQSQIKKLEERAEKAWQKHAALLARPDEADRERDKIQIMIIEAEEERKLFVSKLNAGENERTEADREAIKALTALGEAKAELTRLEERQAAAQEKRTAMASEIEEKFHKTPAQLLASLEADGQREADDSVLLERQLAELKTKRERLGSVNLLAEQECREKQDRLDQHLKAIEEITETVRQLRQAIIRLNREGRARLLDAFTQVNSYFKELFDKLFPGGQANLVLSESDDPLEAGLEIHACPPGKKLQSLTLLSGGEQTLTALALIFAVFLTNPSPVCVLDEADAPLDDVNVARYCDLLNAMVKRTSTRFLVVTHNPLTMSRVNRLFGVTMAEKGLSQIVSVDLSEAEAMIDKVV